MIAGYGKILRMARFNAALSQADLGEIIGVSQAYISAIERGSRYPSKDVRLRLASALTFCQEKEEGTGG